MLDVVVVVVAAGDLRSLFAGGMLLSFRHGRGVSNALWHRSCSLVDFGLEISPCPAVSLHDVKEGSVGDVEGDGRISSSRQGWDSPIEVSQSLACLDVS